MFKVSSAYKNLKIKTFSHFPRKLATDRKLKFMGQSHSDAGDANPLNKHSNKVMAMKNRSQRREEKKTK